MVRLVPYCAPFGHVCGAFRSFLNSFVILLVAVVVAIIDFVVPFCRFCDFCGRTWSLVWPCGRLCGPLRTFLWDPTWSFLWSLSNVLRSLMVVFVVPFGLVCAHFVLICDHFFLICGHFGPDLCSFLPGLLSLWPWLVVTLALACGHFWLPPQSDQF